MSRQLAELIVLMFVGVELAGCNTASTRDVWYAFMDGDTRYGYQHSWVESRGGQRVYASESRILVDVLGAQRQEIASRSEAVVARNLRPISLTVESETMSGPSRIKVSAQNQTLRVDVDRGGAVQRYVHELEGGDRFIFSACIEDWLSALPANADEASIKVFDEEQLRLVRFGVRRGDADRSWRFETEDGSASGTLRCRRDGSVREWRFDMPRVRMVRCTKDDADDIDYKVMTGREMLTFPVDAAIVDPAKLTRLTVRLDWKDVPFEDFNLEDPRQKITERSENGGQFHATLRIDAPDLDGLSSGQSPDLPDESQRFLAETRYIKPGDPQIRKKAAEIVADCRTPLEKVRAISRWVFGYIEGGLIAETLSGPEVLASKQGKCTEYSTLFASLARAADIPTRIALGERMVAGQWMGHMWNESYVGTWVPVDASANEVGTSFALLKFIHSDTVGGTQPLRWRLTESLQISVVDFEMAESPLEDRYETGVDGGVYTNVDFACRLASPSPSWTLEDGTRAGLVKVRFRVPDHDDVLIHFVAFAVPPGTMAKSLINARLGFQRAHYDQFELMTDEPQTIAGAAGHTTCFSGQPKKEGGAIRTTEFLWTRESSGFLLNLISPIAVHDTLLPALLKLVASFEWLEGGASAKND